MSTALGSLVGGIFGLAGQSLNYGFQKRLQDRQNEFNLQMWNLQNEYNSPAAQMKRFEEAGLNPALMYGSASPGNAMSTPQMGTPDAPNISKDMYELGQAFNIEGLKKTIAERKTAEAEARRATAIADDAESDNKALSQLQWEYHFDPNTGMFIFDGGQAPDSTTGNWQAKPLPIDGRVGRMAEAKVMRMLSDNYRTNSLLLPRYNLIGSQKYLNESRKNLLAPQIRMANFMAEPWRMNTNFWIGNVKNGVQTLSNLFSLF